VSPGRQRILFFPIDEAFRPSSFALPILLIALPILAILIIWGVIFAVFCIVIVVIERALGRDKYTKKIISFLEKFSQKSAAENSKSSGLSVSTAPVAARKSSKSTPPKPRPAPEAAAPAGPIRARVTYVKNDGSRSDRLVTLYSRVVVNGVTQVVNVREDGQRVTKRFLLDGFKRLQVPPDLMLDNDVAIRTWIEANIPLKQGNAAGQPEPVKKESAIRPQPSAPAVKVETQIPDRSLEALLPRGAKGFAVFDLETTGTNTNECRIVEVALVRVSPQGRIVEVWESLVNPEGRIPEDSSKVHRIRDRDVGRAPRFEEIANLFAAKIDGHVLVAHNLRRFDLPVLQRHFRDYSGVALELGGGICTLENFPGNPDRGFRKKLPDLCAVQGVAFDPDLAHSALGDALPLAKSLATGISHLKPSAEMVQVQSKLSLKAPAQVWTRGMLASLPEMGWVRENLMLKRGQIFCTTGPATRKTDTPIRRAQAHAENLGLQYVKANSLSKKSPPDFLLSTSLELENTKMRQARERRIPILLIEQVHKLTTLERPVVAWLSSDE